MSTTEENMLKILVDEISELNLQNGEDLLRSLLGAQNEAANATDRRQVQKRISSLIDDALKAEMEG